MNNLTIKQLSKTYPNGVKALQDINLTISNGMFGLLGANGAGKSSLMRTIATLQTPTAGDIIFNGQSILEDPVCIRQFLGYLPQEFGVYPKISTEKLLDHIAVLKGIVSSKDRKEQINALLERTNLYQHRKKAVHTFSGGMRQRFGIAQALLGQPKIMIVDEPTAGLDPQERNRFLNLLSEIGEQVIVILSTHIVEDVLGLCTDMAILANGQIIKTGAPARMVAELEGQIYTKTLTKEDTHTPFAEKVLSSRLVAGQTQIRVKANQLPEGGFEKANPNLEDVYFEATQNLN
ncbi:ABC transporter ATP-binding protein [Limibacter armeniacum]|uniref:ABC transporter ATP-binding protein n=1 Tax=Limibacter armeniacum TaxID=466084 RepID=UPI002FE62B04